jgi:hypothetical protein
MAPPVVQRTGGQPGENEDEQKHKRASRSPGCFFVIIRTTSEQVMTNSLAGVRLYCSSVEDTRLWQLGNIPL